MCSPGTFDTSALPTPNCWARRSSDIVRSASQLRAPPWLRLRQRSSSRSCRGRRYFSSRGQGQDSSPEQAARHHTFRAGGDTVPHLDDLCRRTRRRRRALPREEQLPVYGRRFSPISTPFESFVETGARTSARFPKVSHLAAHSGVQTGVAEPGVQLCARRFMTTFDVLQDHERRPSVVKYFFASRSAT